MSPAASRCYPTSSLFLEVVFEIQKMIWKTTSGLLCKNSTIFCLPRLVDFSHFLSREWCAPILCCSLTQNWSLLVLNTPPTLFVVKRSTSDESLQMWLYWISFPEQEQLPEKFHFVKLLETDPEASQDPRSIFISSSTADLFIGGRDFTFQVNSLPSSDECLL